MRCIQRIFLLFDFLYKRYIVKQKSKYMKIEKELLFQALNLKAFTTDEEAIETLKFVELWMTEILSVSLSDWNSVKVIHDQPEVWRLWLKLGEVRLNLHRIAPASDPFFHFHPWPSIVGCIAGGYWHRTGANPKMAQFDPRIHDIASFTEGIPSMMTKIIPGSVYVMTDPCVCHQVIVPSGSQWNSSIMLTSKSYFPEASKFLSRKSPTGKNPPLTDWEKLEVLAPISKFYLGH